MRGRSERRAPIRCITGTDNTKPLATLDGIPAGGKPETLLVLSESNPKQFRVLVLIESIANASPLEFLIPR